MRSTFRFAFAALASLAVSLPSFAQEHQRPRVGVGVGITTFDFNVSMLANSFPAAVPDSIYVPIALTPTFRIEPQIGVATLDQNIGNEPSIETSVVSLGLGVFWLFPASPQMDVYVGGRVVRTSFSQKLKFNPPRTTETTEGSDIRVIPALGGEFSFHPRFSLGAEVQLQLVSFGDRTVNPGGAIIPGGSGLQTAGLFFARVYLF
ncbi:MAG TPA: outer membrane beta-barrel protein [Anaeromyxobacter sp.]